MLPYSWAPQEFASFYWWDSQLSSGIFTCSIIHSLDTQSKPMRDTKKQYEHSRWRQEHVAPNLEQHIANGEAHASASVEEELKAIKNSAASPLAVVTSPSVLRFSCFSPATAYTRSFRWEHVAPTPASALQLSIHHRQSPRLRSALRTSALVDRWKAHR